MVATPYRSRKPLMDEIRLQIFGSPDLSVFLIDLVSAGDSVYSRENLLDIFGDWRENVLQVSQVYFFLQQMQSYVGNTHEKKQ